MKTIGIIYKPNLEKIAKIFEERLKKERFLVKFVTSTISSTFNGVDVSLIIGGDGTILKTVKKLNSPIIGFKGGRLGFLSSYTTKDLDKFIKDLKENSFVEDRRSLLKVYNKHIEKYCLNDAVAMKEPAQKMVDISVSFKDGEFYFHADGVIVSTPTGSTAYALSLGGSILLPNVNAFEITPIAPQFLATRSVIVPDTEEISVKTNYKILLILDGEIVGNFDFFKIKKSDKQIVLLRPKDYDFSKSIKEKMGYGKNFFTQVR
ncbi:NAD(+) kinase [Thermosipho ferrireducens]|uniref:NAD kinase n=1 Tax=Thermosipho ferrireducens TaxID=2571116 RepID=A0ABX7S6S3_9BACT|nr:NAD(+) kinase [Thermosipho ferrireducens]QTA37465.1 NAD(+) kinase [Thermosipho ferrireducens]